MTRAHRFCILALLVARRHCILVEIALCTSVHGRRSADPRSARRRTAMSPSVT